MCEEKRLYMFGKFAEIVFLVAHTIEVASGRVRMGFICLIDLIDQADDVSLERTFDLLIKATAIYSHSVRISD